MKYKLNMSKEMVSIPLDIINNIDNASDIDLRFILLFLTEKYNKEEDYAKALDVDISEVNNAISFWRGAGVLSINRSGKAKESRIVPPVTSADDFSSGIEIEKVLDANSELQHAIDKIQDILERTTLTRSEISIITYMHESLGLPIDYILLLCMYCKKQEKKNLTYIQKLAIEFSDNGITTYEKLEKEIEMLESAGSLEYRIRKMFGIGSRAFTSKEKVIVDSWINNKIEFESLKEAFDQMMNKIQEPSFPYMDKVVSSMIKQNSNGTTEDPKPVQKRKYKKNETAEEKGFDIDSFYAAALNKRNKKGEN